ncbi:unnamed protein product [Trichobilharzia szidati]|nr:unnamed protein product [Trichobilharzia szidati]
MQRGRKSLVSKLKLSYCCEWKDCSSSFDDKNSLKRHQLQHFKALCEQVSQSMSHPTCGICDSPINVSDPDEIERHSFFHSWVNHLKVVGKHSSSINDWPSCMCDSKSCNSIPELPTKFECGWEYCDFKTNDVSVFIDHVSKHSEEYNDSRYPKGVGLKCLWEDCTYVARRLKNLTGHLDTHTQNKRAACPTCGLLVVNFRKLEDHLKRQQIHLLRKNANVNIHHSVKPVKCNRCQRLFSTQRLLATHMKRHINTMKCPYCDMTALGKSALERHILFRHTNEKSFPCPHCPLAFKVADILERHLKAKHDKMNESEEDQNAALTDSSIPIINNNPIDLNAKRRSSHSTSIAPVHGPLAQHGALPLINTDLLTLPEIDTPQYALDRFICPHDGCDYKTNKRNGYLIHIGRKHNLLPTNVTPSDEQNNRFEDSSNNSQERLYICHLCHTTKRRGWDLSKHLVNVHHLSRPSGHARFTYTISNDGHYRLQLTRLDTVDVAAELLGENVVSKLLVETNTQKQLPVCQ